MCIRNDFFVILSVPTSLALISLKIGITNGTTLQIHN
jgi:hypothetical protein